MKKVVDYIGGAPLRGVVVRQPYAQMVLHSNAVIMEKGTDYRGWVVICSGKAGYSDKDVEQMSGLDLKSHMDDIMKGRNPNYGRGIFLAKLVDCRLARDEDYKWVYMKPAKGQRHLHIYEDVVRVVPEPITGRVGYFGVKKEELDGLYLM